MSSESPTEYEAIQPSDAPSSTTKGAQGPAVASGVSESTWGIGIATLSCIVIFYLLALAFAVLHLVMFLRLDGQLTDADGFPSQTYVAALSTFLVNSFATSLAISLGLAFTQYLWRLFRTRPMAVSTVEALYSLQSSPLSLLTWAAWAVAPVICLMALTILLLAAAKPFPPGALTVVARDLTKHVNRTVPWFQPDYMGNTSLISSQSHSLASYTVMSSTWAYIASDHILSRVSDTTLSMGEVQSSESPCGPNCTYQISFDGPHFVCNSSTDIVLDGPTYLADALYVFPYFSAAYEPDTVGNPPPWITTVVTFPSLVFNVSHPIGLENYMPYGLVSRRFRVECQPAAVTYDLTVSFDNGVRSLSYALRDDVRLLSDIYVIDALPPYTPDIYAPNNWTEDEISNYRVINLFALTDSVAQSLIGTYPMIVEAAGNIYHNGSESVQNITLSNGTELGIVPQTITYFSRTGYGNLEPNRTIVAFTYLNKNRNKRDPSSWAVSPDIEISAAILNEALANVTMSAMNEFSLWTTTANTTTFTSHTFYSFSHPNNLFLPYGLSLLMALPFIVLGIVALVKNGVPAMGGGSFLQVLMTTGASQRLNKAAVGGCLGSGDNIPDQLKERRILFGEIDDSNQQLLAPASVDKGGAVRRAGFGFEDEVMPLRKGGQYGAWE